MPVGREMDGNLCQCEQDLSTLTSLPPVGCEGIVVFRRGEEKVALFDVRFEEDFFHIKVDLKLSELVQCLFEVLRGCQHEVSLVL